MSACPYNPRVLLQDGGGVLPAAERDVSVRHLPCVRCQCRWCRWAFALVMVPPLLVGRSLAARAGAPRGAWSWRCWRVALTPPLFVERSLARADGLRGGCGGERSGEP